MFLSNLCDSYSLHRMLRAPQMLTCSCSLRPLLLLKESHTVACSEPIRAAGQDGRAVKDWSYKSHSSKEETSLFTENLSFPTCKPLLNSESLSQSLKAVKILDYFINGTCFPSRKKLWDTCPTSLSLTTKTGCNFQRPHRDFSLSAQQPWMFDHFHGKSRVCLHLTRAASQAEPHVTGTWRDCLSPENENRCRQRLVSNLKFYEENKERQWMSSRKNQAKWAAVLVALCSVEGEPAFLFTLRSSKLKGRHKGDVRWEPGCGVLVMSGAGCLICNLLAALREERMILQTEMWWPLPWGKPRRSWGSPWQQSVSGAPCSL